MYVVACISSFFIPSGNDFVLNPASGDGYQGYFYFWFIVIKSTMNMHIQVFLTSIFNILKPIPKSRITE